MAGKPKSNITDRTRLASTAKKATVVRTLPNKMVALSDGNVVQIQPGIQGITVGSHVIYVMGGLGVNTGFAQVIGHG